MVVGSNRVAVTQTSDMAPALSKKFFDIHTNYRVWIHSETGTWQDNNIHSTFYFIAFFRLVDKFPSLHLPSMQCMDSFKLTVKQEIWPVWVKWCLFKSSFRTKDLSHKSHLNGFWPVWRNSCLDNSDWVLKAFPQFACLQTNGFSSWWTLWWIL